MNEEKISPNDQERSRTWPIARLLATAERELSAFVAAVTELFDAEQARQAAERWMEELEWTDWTCENPATDCRRVTIAAANGLAGGLKGQTSRDQ